MTTSEKRRLMRHLDRAVRERDHALRTLDKVGRGLVRCGFCGYARSEPGTCDLPGMHPSTRETER